MNDGSGTGNKKLQVLAVIERDEKPTIWRQVGVAFQNRDGSTTLYLDAFPIGTNKLQVREEREWQRPANGAGASIGPAIRPAPTDELDDELDEARS